MNEGRIDYHSLRQSESDRVLAQIKDVISNSISNADNIDEKKWLAILQDNEINLQGLDAVGCDILVNQIDEYLCELGRPVKQKFSFFEGLYNYSYQQFFVLVDERKKFLFRQFVEKRLKYRNQVNGKAAQEILEADSTLDERQSSGGGVGWIFEEEQ